MEFKVKSITAYNDIELEDILNKESFKLTKQGWKIITIMFIGNNVQMARIYQIVMERD